MNSSSEVMVPFLSNFGLSSDAHVCIPYALRRIHRSHFSSLIHIPDDPQVGDVVLAQVQKVGKNTYLELADGRRRYLRAGDYLAVAFGNRYATSQYEAYARADGDRCDLISVGGMCGLVKSKHVSVPEPTRLRLLGAIADGSGQPLRMSDFKLMTKGSSHRPRVIAICGTSMDSGKTYAASSLITGLSRAGHRVAGVKLTGSAAGRDTWSLLDAGSCTALDFIDGGLPSTYLCSTEALMDLYELLINEAGRSQADYAVVEIADGVLQRETSALLQNPRFVDSVHAFIVTASDSLGAIGAVSLLRDWEIEPLAVSGIVSMGPLHIIETQEATKLPCVTATDLQSGKLNSQIDSADHAGRGVRNLQAT